MWSSRVMNSLRSTSAAWSWRGRRQARALRGWILISTMADRESTRTHRFSLGLNCWPQAKATGKWRKWLASAKAHWSGQSVRYHDHYAFLGLSFCTKHKAYYIMLFSQSFSLCNNFELSRYFLIVLFQMNWRTKSIREQTANKRIMLAKKCSVWYGLL